VNTAGESAAHGAASDEGLGARRYRALGGVFFLGGGGPPPRPIPLGFVVLLGRGVASFGRELVKPVRWLVSKGALAASAPERVASHRSRSFSFRTGLVLEEGRVAGLGAPGQSFLGRDAKLAMELASFGRPEMKLVCRLVSKGPSLLSLQGDLASHRSRCFSFQTRLVFDGAVVA
jgi:hypothetical protein